ncbi:EboA domain-containing protein [Streptomyces sp. 11-1-2]|uniref:EboA domain-containing protein n=1 Tax=unclassified Streptomyces TaxID=2593676 RepID=UPI001968CCDB|nr:EboA domain-containing protein [Streptomyces sp. 11-1-2]
MSGTREVPGTREAAGTQEARDAGEAPARPEGPGAQDDARRAEHAGPPAPGHEAPVVPTGGSADRRRLTAPGDPTPHDLPDAARILILHAADADAPTAARLYARGTGAERRAVLLALPHLRLDASDAVPLVEDALRTNDTRLVAAAVGPYAARHLSPHSWRQAVLKCLFTGVPLTAVAEWERRARGDAELARMLTDYARERTAAGRPVPADLDRVLALTCQTAATAPTAATSPTAATAPTRALTREES